MTAEQPLPATRQGIHWLLLLFQSLGLPHHPTSADHRHIGGIQQHRRRRQARQEDDMLRTLLLELQN